MSKLSKKTPAKKTLAKKARNAKKCKNIKPKSRRLAIGVILGVICALLLSVLYLCLALYRPSDFAGGTLIVNDGDTYYSLAKSGKLPAHSFANPLILQAFLKFNPQPPLAKGNYVLPKNASFVQSLAALQHVVAAPQIVFTVIEGKTVRDLLHDLRHTDGVQFAILDEGKDYQTWADAESSRSAIASALGFEHGEIEGMFAPDTYHFDRGTTDLAILQKLSNVQGERLAAAWDARAADLPYQNPYELLTMASIVERETGVAAERSQVAAVFVNRLNQQMRLQTDPTIIYGLFDRYDGKIYKSNIVEKTAYNTYQIDGLPPSPIALPSKAALAAAANPDKHHYLYFVATGNGGHQFSETLAQHNAAVAAYRAILASKDGAKK